MNIQEIANKYCIFKCLAGSHSYGTNIPSSDVDIRGVFIAPPDNIISTISVAEQSQSTEADETIFEIRKFIMLAAENNPNIIELLYTDESNIQFIDWPMQILRENAHLFLSKKARHSFSGYAMSQLHRIKGHNKWISNPQSKDPPHLKDYCKLIHNNGHVCEDGLEIEIFGQKHFLVETFGTTIYRVYKSDEFFKEKLGFFTLDGIQLKYVDVKEDVLNSRAQYVGTLIINIEEYKKKRRTWKDYWEWKKNRNPVRAELEEKYGYDLKHSLHLVRLMTMCQEILTIGKVIVRRPDAQYLLNIRNGQFDYDWLIKWAKDMDESMNKLYETSKLPYSADYESIDKLYRKIIFRYWKEKQLINTITG